MPHNKFYEAFILIPQHKITITSQLNILPTLLNLDLQRHNHHLTFTILHLLMPIYSHRQL